MELLIHYAVPFLILLTVLVFVHELGHYLVARRNGVRVEIFSIGFGPELFGFNDRAGTRWKFSAIPFGGYVKMFGDTGVASQAAETVQTMSPAERRVSFHHKRLSQRAAIIFAGPAANFLFAIVVLTVLFATAGEPYTPPVIQDVLTGSAAEQGGLRPGDVVLQLDGSRIERFEDIHRIVLMRPGQAMPIVVNRDGHEVTLTVQPRLDVTIDNFGNEHRIGLLGIRGGERIHRKLEPPVAAWRAVVETGSLSANILESIGQMIQGTRNADEVGGPIAMARLSGEVVQLGAPDVLWFLAVVSINLGLLNLFPVPPLDGGHLLLYAAEAIRGRPLGERAQEWGFRIGLALVLSLMVFATWNDLSKLFFKDLAS